MGRNTVIVLLVVTLFLTLSSIIGANKVLEAGVVVAVLSILSIVLFKVYVQLRVNLNASNLERDKARYQHEEKVLDLGFLPNGGQYSQLAQLPSADLDMPVSVSGETVSSVSEFAPQAYELVYMTVKNKKFGPHQTQIIPFNKARLEGETFKDVRVWQEAVKWLWLHGYVSQRKRKGVKGEKIEGTFVVQGTVGEVLAKLNPPTPYLKGG